MNYKILIKISALSILILSFCLKAQYVENGAFIIEHNNELSGFSIYSLSPTKTGWDMESRTFQRSKTDKSTTFDSSQERTVLNFGMEPLTYLCTKTRDNESFKIDVTFTDKSATIASSNIKEKTKSISIEDKTFLYDDLINHYILIAKRINPSSNLSKTFNIIEPTKLSTGYITTAPADFMYYDGKAVRQIDIYMDEQLDASIWIDSLSRALVQVELPNENISAYRKVDIDTLKIKNSLTQ